MRIAATGGTPEEVTRLDPPQQIGHQSPRFLPDGRHFLFLAHGSPSASGIYLGTLDGGAPKRLMPSDVAAAYLEPHYLVFVQQGALVARRLDVVRGELTGDSMPLADAVGYDVSFRLGAFSVSAVGSVAYQTRIFKRDGLSWVDRTTRKASRVPVNALDVNALGTPALSPDGRRVAVTLESQNNFDIWIMDLVGGSSTRFTNDAALDAWPVWSPDGTQIVFSSTRKGNPNLYLKPSNGPPGSERLLREGVPAMPLDWSSDGRFLVYMVVDDKTGPDLWALDMTGNAAYGASGGEHSSPKNATASFLPTATGLPTKPMSRDGSRLSWCRFPTPPKNGSCPRAAGRSRDGTQTARNCTSWHPTASSWPCRSRWGIRRVIRGWRSDRRSLYFQHGWWTAALRMRRPNTQSRATAGS